MSAVTFKKIKGVYFTINTSDFFTHPQTRQLEKVTCPEKQMYNSDTLTHDIQTPDTFHKRSTSFSFQFRVRDLTLLKQ